jgi:hypothetical protein
VGHWVPLQAQSYAANPPGSAATAIICVSCCCACPGSTSSDGLRTTPVYKMVGTPSESTAAHPEKQPSMSGVWGLGASAMG